MKSIREAIERLLERIGVRKVDLGIARRRHKRFRELAEREHKRQLHQENLGHTLRAAWRKRRAERRHVKAVYWKGRVRRETARLANLHGKLVERENEQAAWERKHKVRVEGNRVSGGSKRARLKAALLASESNYQRGEQPGYYSMSGAYPAYDHALIHYPYGHRWDCSSYGDGIYLCARVGVDPSGGDWRLGGYTATQLEHGEPVHEDAAQPGDLVLYLRYNGDRIGHHVEVVLDPQRKVTMGHGDAAIDRAGGGSVGYDIFGDGLYEIRKYI